MHVAGEDTVSDPSRKHSETWLVALSRKADPFFIRHAKPLRLLLLLLLLIECARLVYQGKMGDFVPIYTGATRLLAGEPLYLERTSAAYVYSPFIAFLFSPLTMLPLGFAKALFFVLCCFSALAAMRLTRQIIWRDVREMPPETVGFYFLTLSSSLYFWWNALGHGQSTPLMVALCIASYHYDLKEKPLVSGASLALALSFKPFPIVFLFFYAVQRRWRTVASSMAFLALSLLLPLLWFGSSYREVLGRWTAVSRQQQYLHDITTQTHQSVSAMWYRFFGHARPDPFALDITDPAVCFIVLTWLAIISLVVLMAIRSRSGPAANPASSDALFGACMICWAVLPPTAWKHYYVTLLFPAALVARVALRGSAASRPASHVLASLVASLLILSVLRSPGHWLSLPVLGALLLLSCLFSCQRRSD